MDCNNFGYKCRPGWGDCRDGDSDEPSGVANYHIGEDGCETNIHEGQRLDDYTILNCGACNATCNPQHVTKATCENSVCSYEVCSDGYIDCDGDKTNGCETQLGTAENCSVCGHTCLDGGCKDGACCWDASFNARYTTQELTAADCCPGTKLYKACDNDTFHKARYTCATDATIGKVPTDGVCKWREVN